MKVSYLRLFFFFVLVSILSACGGGGDSSSVNVSLNKTTLSFTAVKNAALPELQQIVATFEGDGVLVGVPVGETLPSWLSVEYASSPTTTQATFNVSITSASIASGTYNATLRFVTGSDATGEIDFEDIVVSYVLIDELAVAETQLTFNSAIGNINPIDPQSLSITGTDINWVAESNQSWLSLSQGSGIGAATVNVSVDDSGLSVGEHIAAITITNTENSFSKTVNVTLNITLPDFSFSQSSFSFSGVNGKSIDTASLSVELNTGISQSWSVSSDQPWLVLNKVSGTTPDTVILSIDAQSASLASGSHSAVLTFTTTISGNVITKEVTASLNLTAMTFNALPSPLSVSGINGNDLGSSIINFALDTDAYDHGWTITSNKHWLLIDGLSSKSGTNSGSAAITVDASLTPALASGTWSGVLTFEAMVNGDVITNTVNVSLDLTKAVFTLSQESLAVSGINGSDLGSTDINFDLNTVGNNYDWTVTSNQHWLLIDGLSSTSGTNSSTAAIAVDASVAPALASGSWSGVLTLETTVNGDTISKTIDVSLDLTEATLTLSQSSLTFEGINGSDLGTQTLSLNLNTGSQSYPWSIVNDSGTGLSWMQLDIASGLLAETASVLTFSTNETALLGDVYPGSTTITVLVNGDTLTSSIPVNLRLDPQKLFVADNGVLLNDFPTTTSQLTHTVKVTDNAEQGVTWAATDDAAWLSVTANGTTGATDLVLTANPVSLSSDTLHTATVTLTSTDSKIENSETVTVGFYVSSSEPVSSTSLSLTDPGKTSSLVADPVRPYVYVSHGGANIDIYNVYTGVLNTTMTSLGGDLQAMTVSGDGTYLYAMDQSNNSIVKVNLNTQSLGTTFTGLNTSSCPTCYHTIDYTKINSYPVLITAGNKIVDAADGAILGALTNPNSLLFISSSPPLIQASANGKVAVAQSIGSSPFHVARYQLDYSALETGTFTAEMTHRATGSGPGRDIAINDAGSSLYMASGSGCGETTSYAVCEFSGSDLTYVGELVAGAYPVAVEISPDESVFVGIQTTGIDVKKYDSSSVLTGSYADIAASLYDRQLVLSGGGSMMITRSKRWTGSIYTNNLDFTLVTP